MEKELGISYPTVKNRLEDVADALGYGLTQGYSPPGYDPAQGGWKYSEAEKVKYQWKKRWNC